MKEYLITKRIKAASGWQCWSVHAEDADEAKMLFEAGEGDFCDEEVEVTDLEEGMEIEERDEQ